MRESKNGRHKNAVCRLPAQLVIGPSDKSELLQRNTNGFQHGLDHSFVVTCSVSQQFPRSLHVVKVRMKISEQHRDLKIHQLRSCVQSRNICCKYRQTWSKTKAAFIGIYLASSSQKVGQLGHGYEIGDVRLPRGRCSPVNLHIALFENLFQFILAHNFLQNCQGSSKFYTSLQGSNAGSFFHLTVHLDLPAGSA